MDYCLAGDDGTAAIWNGQPDLDLNGDGRLDAIGLDFDGDGMHDDALADLDGDLVRSLLSAGLTALGGGLGTVAVLLK